MNLETLVEDGSIRCITCNAQLSKVHSKTKDRLEWKCPTCPEGMGATMLVGESEE